MPFLLISMILKSSFTDLKSGIVDVPGLVCGRKSPRCPDCNIINSDLHESHPPACLWTAVSLRNTGPHKHFIFSSQQKEIF